MEREATAHPEPAEGAAAAERPPVATPSGGHPAPAARDPEAVDHGRRALSTWLWRLPVLAAAGGAAYGVWQAYAIHFAKDAPDPNPVFAPVADVGVAPLSAFADVWDGVEFVAAGVPCVAVRVPAPVPGGLDVGVGVHLVAFSRVCTHLACIVELNRDVETVAFAFNYRSDRPSLTCACHFSVFDPLRAGRAVSGPAVRPLPRARLRLEGDLGGDARVVCDGLERSS
ncbi:MAG: Rieske 2Fe-2S domain-containing protein [Trueperaceae bacterium]